MKIGVVAEIKDQENRAGLTPVGAKELVQRGYSVVMQAGAPVLTTMPTPEPAAESCPCEKHGPPTSR